MCVIRATQSTVTSVAHLKPEMFSHRLVMGLQRAAPSMASLVQRYRVTKGIGRATWKAFVEPTATGPARLMDLVRKGLAKRPNSPVADTFLRVIKNLVVESNLLVQGGQHAVATVMFLRMNGSFMIQRRFSHLNMEESTLKILRYATLLLSLTPLVILLFQIHDQC